MDADLAKPADATSWLEIVREVEPLFGPMPGFAETLLRKIEQRSALCVRFNSHDMSTSVQGGMLLGGASPHGWIRWLAVRSSTRRMGIGRCLVQAAIDRLAGASTISVDTFCEENIAGRPARRLYERMGFLPTTISEVEGQARQRYGLIL